MIIIKDDGDNVFTLTDSVKKICIWVDSSVLVKHQCDYPWYIQIVDDRTVYIFTTGD